MLDAIGLRLYPARKILRNGLPIVEHRQALLTLARYLSKEPHDFLPSLRVEALARSIWQQESHLPTPVRAPSDVPFPIATFSSQATTSSVFLRQQPSHEPVHGI